MEDDNQLYYRLEHKMLFQSLLREDFAQALVNLIDKEKTDKFSVIAHPHSIEISSSEICIAIIIFSGFEEKEYNVLKFHSNLHLVTLYWIIPEMLEFKSLKIQYIDPKKLVFEILNNSEFLYAKMLNNIAKLE